MNGIRFVHFDETDVVRHPLVQRIVKAYEPLRRGDRLNRQLSFRLTEPGGTARANGAEQEPETANGNSPAADPAARI